MRPPSFSCTWCSGASWSSVAEYSFTGTLTSPKLSEPFQMERIPSSSSPRKPFSTPLRRTSLGTMSGKAEQIVTVAGHRLKLTNLDKVLYPDTGTTKAEVLDYYTRVADVLIPHARNRPVTRKRWVEGVGTAVKPGSV